MNDNEISYKLARAIGWPDDRIRLTLEYGLQVLSYQKVAGSSGYPWWRKFDYLDMEIAFSLAQHYNLIVDFNNKSAVGTVNWHYGKTVQEAIALCVIDKTNAV